MIDSHVAMATKLPVDYSEPYQPLKPATIVVTVHNGLSGLLWCQVITGQMLLLRSYTMMLYQDPGNDDF